MKNHTIYLLLALLGASVSCSANTENPAVTPAIRNPWLDQHKRIDARLQRGPSDILFIGDSITFNWSSNSRGKPVWDKHYAKMDIVNMGISGDKTENILWRLQNGSLKEVDPKVAVVLAGINNIHRDSPEEIAAGVEAVVNEVLEDCPSCQVLLMGLFPRGYQPTAMERPKVKAVNAIISKMAENPRIEFLDIGEQFLDEDGVFTKEMSPDALHPLAPGYEIWANAMDPIIREMLSNPTVAK
ncbi:GDSL-type esterase/lipase family protein [Coraliomargarita parva]|uniref:GDSL-type esterase/lipase family protein n=1 Tax=Coraliomargarita parva TaxID=3014050 RepID=UPI0022B2F886|nr:GDSL-type esterase/lipase family protein [Coraliomargarita parva]